MIRKFSRKHALNILILTVVALLPLLYAGLFTWAYEKPLEKLDQIQALVVNEDEPALLVTPDGKKEQLHIGEDLTKKILEPDAPGFSWEEGQAEQARTGLTDGKYQVVLWIPAELSSNAAKLGKLSAADLTKTEIKLETNDANNYLTGTMAASVAAKLQNILEETGATDFANKLLLSYGDIHEKLSTAANGASELATGTSELATGAQKIADGQGSLQNGLGQLKTGANKLENGSKKLSNGTQQLSQGAGKINTGVTSYTSGVDKLAIGLKTISEKLGNSNQTTGLLNGLNKIVAATGPETNSIKPTTLSGALQAIATGGSTLSSGANQLRDGAERINQGITQLHTNSAKVAQQIPAAAAGVTQIVQQFQTGQVDGKPTLRSGLDALANTLNPDGTGETIGVGTKQIAHLATALSQVCTNLPADPACAIIASQGVNFQSLPAQAQKLTSALTSASNGATHLSKALVASAPQVQQLKVMLEPGPDPIRNPQTLSDYVNTVSRVTATSNTTEAHSPDSMQQPTLADGSARLAQGAAQIRTGANQIADAARRTSTQFTALHNGLVQARDGVALLSPAVASASQGAMELQNNSSSLRNAAQQLATGAGQLATQVPQLSQGVSALSTGITSTNQGSLALTEGANKLAEGANKASNGASSIANGLDSGKDQIPVLSAADAKAVAKVASSPVQVKAVRANAVAENGIGFAPFFMALALWVGSIALFLIYPALRSRRTDDEPFYVSAFRSLLPTSALAIAQAFLVVLGMSWLLPLHAEKLFILFVVCALSAVCFTALNQAFVAVFGFRGRFLSVLMLLIQVTSAGATFPVETAPGFFRFLNPILPLTYTARSIRAYIAGGDIAVHNGFLVLTIWLVGALLATLIAAWRKREEVHPHHFDPALASAGPGRKYLATELEQRPTA